MSTMETNERSAQTIPDGFSLRRLGLLLKSNFVFQARTLAIAAAVGLGGFIFLYMVSLPGRGNFDFGDSFFAGVLVIPVLIVASMAFSDAHRGSRAVSWYMLPVSAPEKFLATWLSVFVFLTAGLLVLFTLADLIATGLSMLFFGVRHTAFDPFSADTWRSIGFLWAVHPVFLFGSMRFRRLAFLRTAGWIFLTLFVLSLIGFGFAWLIFNPFSQSWNHGFYPVVHLQGTFFSGLMESGVLPVLSRIGAWVIFPGFFLAATYLRLRETEVNYGVR